MITIFFISCNKEPNNSSNIESSSKNESSEIIESSTTVSSEAESSITASLSNYGVYDDSISWGSLH